ncbi:MAG: hypothetical protein P4M01_03085 [Acidobacteriota bacterium]|nr:hypothetical protein [Acidobacteriota bacterium]
MSYTISSKNLLRGAVPALAAVLLAFSIGAQAQAVQTPQDKTVGLVTPSTEEGGPAQGSAAPGGNAATKASEPPLVNVGKALNNHGISPIFNVVQFWLGDPKMGQNPGNWEELTLLTVGADVDMNKLIGYKGGNFHFTELLVPTTHNTQGYGTQVGDTLVGQPGPYIPYFPHLTRLTWEHKAFNNKFELEFGKANAGTWFVKSVCLVDFGCQSLLAQYDGGFGESPTPYADWLVRSAFHFNKALTLQVSTWRENATFPWSDGWEIGKTPTFHGARPDSNVYLADLSYRTDPRQDKYAKDYEFSYAHNTAQQNRELSIGNGFSNPTKDQHMGTDIIYAAGRQGVHNFSAPGTAPKPFSVYGQLTQSLDSKNVSGLYTDFKAGVIQGGLIKGHPADQISLKYSLVRTTQDMYDFENSANIAAGGSGFKNGRNEQGLGVEAFLLTKYVIAMPFAQRVWNPNTLMNPSYGGQTKAGWGFGTMLIFPLDGILGLDGGHH